MARSKMVATAVALLLCLAGASASGRNLQQTTLVPCASYMSAAVTSTNSAIFNSAFTSAFDSCFKSFCDQTCPSTCANQLYVPTNPVVATAIAAASPAIATATATAMTQVTSTGFIAGDCSGFVSTVDAYAKAQTMAKALSVSFASAVSKVVGAQGYSQVKAELDVTTSALQATCLKQFTEINPAKLRCYRKLDASGNFVTCPTTWSNTQAQSRYNSLSTAQKNKCFVVECSFAPNVASSQITSTVTTSAQAIAEAVSKVTVTTNAGTPSACVYNGQQRLCSEFVSLCNAVCAGDECRDPLVEDYCSPEQGDWAELPNGDYKCQNLCDNGNNQAHCEYDTCEGCTTQTCDWICV